MIGDPMDLAPLTSRQRNALPDSAFLHVKSGGKKDDAGRTVPRSLRMFPVRKADGSVDLPRLRNALARIPQSELPLSLRKRLSARARKMLDNVKNKPQSASLFVMEQDPFVAASPRYQTKEASDIPRRRFVKDVIRVGKFVHPGNGVPLDVTAGRLDKWAKTFGEMTVSGIDIGVPLHTHSGENGGYIRDMWRDGDRLMALFDMVGEDAIRAVARNKVSVRIDPQYQTGEGVTFRDAITHVAVVPEPVITRQGDFRPLAASISEDVDIDSVVWYTLCSAREGDDHKGSDMETKAIVELAAKSGLKVVDLGDDATPEDAIGAVLKLAIDAGKRADEASAAAKKAQAELSAAGAANDADDKPIEMTANERYYATSGVKARLMSLVAAGNITPAVADKIGADPLLQSPMMLSVGEDGSDPPAIRLLSYLAENDPVKLGEKTRGQRTDLGRDVPGGDGPAAYDPDVTKEMIQMAGGVVAS